MRQQPVGDAAVAQLAQQPMRHDPHCRFYLRLALGLAWPGGQDGGVVVADQLPMGAVDLRVVEAGLDHGCLWVVRRDRPPPN